MGINTRFPLTQRARYTACIKTQYIWKDGSYIPLSKEMGSAAIVCFVVVIKICASAFARLSA